MTTKKKNPHIEFTEVFYYSNSTRWLKKHMDRICEKEGRSVAAVLREAFCEHYSTKDRELREDYEKFKELNDID